jgi:hypothetical protein
VIAVTSADGSPPHVFQRLTGGRVAIAPPDRYSRVVPAGETVVTEGSGAAA